MWRYLSNKESESRNPLFSYYSIPDSIGLHPTSVNQILQMLSNLIQANRTSLAHYLLNFFSLKIYPITIDLIIILMNIFCASVIINKYLIFHAIYSSERVEVIGIKIINCLFKN